jgi:hypothetical protein
VTHHNDHDNRNNENFHSRVEEKEKADILVGNIKVDRADNHHKPTTDVDGGNDELIPSETFKIIDVHDVGEIFYYGLVLI